MSRYLLDESELYRESFILLCAINSSKQNHEMLDPYFKKGHSWAGIYFSEWGLIQDTLISLAVKLRIIDDLFTKSNQSYNLPFHHVGCIIENSVEKELSFRNACNKIVHATEFQPETVQTHNSRTTPQMYAYYTSFVTLQGENGKRQWAARIDLHKYILSALALTTEYDENWAVSSRND